MLSPFFTPLHGARIVSVSPGVVRFPFSVVRTTRWIRPTALTIPVNIAACPIPIMYQSPERAAPPASSAAPPRGGAAAPRERPERRLHRATPVPAPSRAGPPDRLRGRGPHAHLHSRTGATLSPPRAARVLRHARAGGRT